MTEEKFLAYEEIRQSGVTNMWNVQLVCELSGWVLTKDDCFDIMNHYAEYAEKWLEQ